MITNADYLFLMQHLPVLEDISFDRLLIWVQRMAAITYAGGTKIQCGGDDRVGLLLLKSGMLRIYLLSREGREITLYHLQAGEVCLLSTALASGSVTFEVHIEAETDCEALLLEAEAFDGFCRTHTCIEIYFGRLLMKRLSISAQALERALSLSLDQRLATFLIDGVSEPGCHDITLTHDQIARHIGSTREVVTRALNQFAAQGMVKLTRRNVEVLDRAELDRLIS